MERIAVVILAGGLGKRMGQDEPKALTQAGGKALINHVLDAVSGLKADRTIVVTGYKRELLEQSLAGGKKGCLFAHQKEQLGTGDAVKAALPELKGFTGTVLLLAGDMPLVREETLRGLVDLHAHEKATVTVLTLKGNPPASFGRVVRDSKGNVEKIIERRDCKPRELFIDETNSAIYAVDSAFLTPAINDLKNDNSQKEYYLTDIVERASKEGQRVAALQIFDQAELQGVNTSADLQAVERTLLLRRVSVFAESGVTFHNPLSAIIDEGVTIAPGVVIGQNVILRGKTSIGKGVVIDGSAYLSDTEVGEGAHLKFGIRADGAKIGKTVNVGPFAHLRPGTVLEEGAHIGNFVETKNTTVGAGSKANHLTYLGDSTIGKNSNIGAGTITCNYDGYNKHQTKIGSGVFIGSNTALVAPVSVDDGAVIGAGSVITQNVEKDSLALTRAPTTVRTDWAKRRRELAKKNK